MTVYSITQSPEEDKLYHYSMWSEISLLQSLLQLFILLMQRPIKSICFKFLTVFQKPTFNTINKLVFCGWRVEKRRGE